MSKVKKQLFEQFALIAQSLGSPQRVEMLDYIAQAERGVEELSQLSNLSIANTSRHLQILKQHGIVTVRKKGKNRLYQLAGDDIIELIACLRITASKHLAEVDKLSSELINHRLKDQTISSQELVKRLNEKSLLLIDVRPTKEFDQGHILGAINIQPEDIEEKSSQLPQNKTIVTYCRGPYCVYSDQMLQSLVLRGITALRLKDGFPEWRAAGLPFESTPNR